MARGTSTTALMYFFTVCHSYQMRLSLLLATWTAVVQSSTPLLRRVSVFDTLDRPLQWINGPVVPTGSASPSVSVDPSGHILERTSANNKLAVVFSREILMEPVIFAYLSEDGAPPTSVLEHKHIKRIVHTDADALAIQG